MLAILSYEVVQADVGSSYCMQATITLKNGTRISGYFNLATYDLAIEQTDNGLYYHGIEGTKPLHAESVGKYEIKIAATDDHFHTYIRRLLFDTIMVYRDMTILQGWQAYDGGSPIPVYLGQPNAVAASGVNDVVVHTVWECEPATAVLTPCVRDDRSWLAQAIPQREALGDGYFCSYTMLYFGANTEKVRHLKEALKKLYAQESELYNREAGSPEEYKSLAAHIRRVLEDLRKHRVIVIGFCSC